MNLAKHSSTENRNKYYPIKLKRTKKQIKIAFLKQGKWLPISKNIFDSYAFFHLRDKLLQYLLKICFSINRNI